MRATAGTNGQTRPDRARLSILDPVAVAELDGLERPEHRLNADEVGAVELVNEQRLFDTLTRLEVLLESPVGGLELGGNLELVHVGVEGCSCYNVSTATVEETKPYNHIT